MATITLTTLPNKIDTQGMTTIYISVNHKRKHAYISTGIKTAPEMFINGKITKGTDIKNKNARLIEIKNKYVEQLSKVNNIDALTVGQLKDRLIEEDKVSYTSIIEAFEHYIHTANTQSTKNTIGQCRDIFLRFCNGKNITLQSVDSFTIKRFVSWLDTATVVRTGKPYSENTKLLFVNHLRILIRRAIKDGKVKYDRNPFADTDIPKSHIRENWIDASVFKIIRNTPATCQVEQLGKDLFELSFYLAGMNIVDIQKQDFREDVITFVRQKTKDRDSCGKVTIPIVPQAREIIAKYMNFNTGILQINCNPHILNSYVNSQFLKRLKAEGKIPQCTTFYSARKCFAQIGLDIGISDNIIDYLLGHSTKKRGVISHYSRLQAEVAEEAMKLIFDFVEHPEDIKEIFRRTIKTKMYE